MAEGTFQPDRERNELTYALGNPEHPGRTRGKGVVPWKYGFRDYIESYRSRQRRKNDEREHLRRLEEQLMSHDQRPEEEVQCQVAIAMSKQKQAQTVPPEPNVVADHLSQRKSSCASTDVAVVESTGSRPQLKRRPRSDFQWMRSPTGHLVTCRLLLRT